MNRGTARLAACLAVAGGALALSALAVPAANAAVSKAAACQNWSVRNNEGHANGTWCSNYTVVSGTVYDDKADGRCPYVTSTWSNGTLSDGPWVGPKGASKSFTLYAPSGSVSTGVNISWVYC